MTDRTPENTDAELRELFRELRDHDKSLAPSFEGLWFGRGTQTAKHKVWGLAALAGVGLAAAAGAAILLLWSAGKQPGQPAFAGLRLADPEPLGFLLERAPSAIRGTAIFDADPFQYNLEHVLQRAEKGRQQ